MIAYVLARRGHETYFITDNEPIFDTDLSVISPDNPVNIVVTGCNFEVLPRGSFDAVFLAPQMPREPRFYKSAVRFARNAQAALFLINYESANWFNAFSPVKRPESKWQEWLFFANQGACILSSTCLSEEYAREFYKDLPPNSGFAVWQPAINSIACDKAANRVREKLVILFSRPTDKHKGGGDIADLIGPELEGYTLGIVIGNSRNSETFLDELRAKAKQYNVVIQPYFAISDLQKFTLLKRAAAIVFPSYFEGYGYPPMEAMAADTPCVAYDLPVVRENCGDRIRYAPVGDVASLRQQLREAISSEGPVTSEDPHVIELTNVDNRGRALEGIITRYLTISRNTGLSGTSPDRHFQFSKASAFRVRAQTHVMLTITAPGGISAARLTRPETGNLQYFERGWGAGGWQYTLFLSPKSGEDSLDLDQTKLALKLETDPAPVELSVKGVEVVRARTPWLEQKFVRAKRVMITGGRALVAGWVYPAVAYDGLFMMDADGQFLALDTAIKDDSYKRLSSHGTSFYGFSSSVINTRQFKLGYLQVLAVREGQVVAKGRLNLEKLVGSAEPLREIGSSAGLVEPLTALSLDIKAFPAQSINKNSWPHPMPGAPVVKTATIGQWIQAAANKHYNRLRQLASSIAPFGRSPNTLSSGAATISIGDYHFDKSSSTLSLEILTDLSDGSKVEVWGGDMSFVGEVTSALSGDNQKTNSKAAKIRSQFKFTGDPEQGIMFRLIQQGRILAQDTIKNLAANPSKNFRIDDCVYDETWKVLWARGTFQSTGADVERIEIRQGDVSFGLAVLDERPGNGSRRSYRWRFEKSTDNALPEGSELSVIAHLADGKSLQIECHAATADTWGEKIAKVDDVLHFAKTGEKPVENRDSLQMAPEALQLLRGEEPLVEAQERVLFVIHNLAAIERPEKRQALVALRKELNKRNAELILLHHSKLECDCEIPEINYFDPILDYLSAQNGDAHADRKILSYAQRMLYGFTFSLNRRPKPWSEIEAQTLDEVARVSTVLDAVRPALVLVWHQWNSLMLLTRAIAADRSLPSAVVHEGMLPGTMTIDGDGMMAESDMVGIKLRSEDTDYERFMECASRVIGVIREKQLDRKPFAGAPAALEIIRNLKKDGKRIVFYAGVNDWQSGNLPADHPRAQQHSPYFQDTEAGLAALLAAAERLDFYVVYKPHPNLFPRPLPVQHDRLIYTREANASDCIQQVDVFATLLSSLAYISLAHETPTVLMGRNTLSDTDAAYELAGPAELDSCLLAAFDRVNFETHLRNFQQHVAALLKNGLYPYGGKTDFATLTYEDAANKILALKNVSSSR
jgi:glycosyltransferase involved in cell wall biosynthesis